jgi:hypothetical protein
MFLRGHRGAVRRRVRQLAIRLGYHSRPGFLVIGAQKAGTTALYYYLAAHPDILPGRDKEIGFFTPETFEDLPGHPHHSILCPLTGSVFSNPTAYVKAALWYHSLFPLPHALIGGKLTFEATPEYLYVDAAAERIFNYDRDMKLLVLLRDPVERAFSAWNMYHNFDDPIYTRIRDTRMFEDAIQAELIEIGEGKFMPGPHYVRRGLYCDQLQRYLDLFGHERLLWIDSRRLASQTATVLDEVAHFLGLRAFTDSSLRRPQIHVGRYESEASAASVRLLRAFYKPHNQRLHELLNHDFGWL